MRHRLCLIDIENCDEGCEQNIYAHTHEYIGHIHINLCKEIALSLFFLSVDSLSLDFVFVSDFVFVFCYSSCSNLKRFYTPIKRWHFCGRGKFLFVVNEMAVHDKEKKRTTFAM